MADKKISALTGASTPLAGTEVLPIVQSGATVKVAVSDLTAGRTVSAAGVNTTGNVGVGATPSAWSTDYAVVELPLGSAIFGYNVAGYPFTAITSNAYYNGTNWKYVSAVAAGATSFRNEGYNSDFVWSTAPAGSAGASVTFTSRMTLDSAGDLTNATGNYIVGTSGKGIDFSATPGTGTSELFADYEEGTWTPIDSSGAGLVLTVANASYTKVGRLVEASFAITFPVTVSGATLRLGGLPFTAKAFGTSMNTVSFSVVQYAIPITCVVDANATTFTPLTYGAGTLTNANMSGLILRGTAIYEV